MTTDTNLGKVRGAHLLLDVDASDFAQVGVGGHGFPCGGIVPLPEAEIKARALLLTAGRDQAVRRDPLLE